MLYGSECVLVCVSVWEFSWTCLYVSVCEPFTEKFALFLFHFHVQLYLFCFISTYLLIQPNSSRALASYLF